MKFLSHYGVYIPKYNPVGLSLKFEVSGLSRYFPLTPLAEQLVIQFVKKFGTPYLEDPKFIENFLKDLVPEIIPKSIEEKYDASFFQLENWDFTDVEEYLDEVKTETDAMTKEEKKKAKELKQIIRNKLKEYYGYAFVDGKKVSIQNWSVEGPGIYFSKGRNPLRGKWKRAIDVSEITLNLSPDASTRELLSRKGFEIVWEPKNSWIAKWPEVFDPTRYKYVWFSPASGIRQKKEQRKFLLADNLEKNIEKLEVFLDQELESPDLERRKLATAVYLMKNLAIRVGDEKVAGERGTIGCTTLKKENITIIGNRIQLSFIGKDYVKWERDLMVPDNVIKNLKELLTLSEEDYLFKNINSGKISRFLREVIPGLSAKVFRTYLAGLVWESASQKYLKSIDENTSETRKKFLFKMINLVVAKKLNHKKTPPKNLDARIDSKEKQLEKAKGKLNQLREKGLKIKTQEAKIEKLECGYLLLKETSQYNLNTSLTSYIDPRKVMAFGKQANISIENLYSKALKEKYSWVKSLGVEQCKKE